MDSLDSFQNDIDVATIPILNRKCDNSLLKNDSYIENEIFNCYNCFKQLMSWTNCKKNICPCCQTTNEKNYNYSKFNINTIVTCNKCKCLTRIDQLKGIGNDNKLGQYIICGKQNCNEKIYTDQGKHMSRVLFEKEFNLKHKDLFNKIDNFDIIVKEQIAKLNNSSDGLSDELEIINIKISKAEQNETEILNTEGYRKQVFLKINEISDKQKLNLNRMNTESDIEKIQLENINIGTELIKIHKEVKIISSKLSTLKDNRKDYNLVELHKTKEEIKNDIQKSKMNSTEIVNVKKECLLELILEMYQILFDIGKKYKLKPRLTFNSNDIIKLFQTHYMDSYKSFYFTTAFKIANPDISKKFRQKYNILWEILNNFNKENPDNSLYKFFKNPDNKNYILYNTVVLLPINFRQLYTVKIYNTTRIEIQDIPTANVFHFNNIDGLTQFHKTIVKINPVKPIVHLSCKDTLLTNKINEFETAKIQQKQIIEETKRKNYARNKYNIDKFKSFFEKYKTIKINCIGKSPLDILDIELCLDKKFFCKYKVVITYSDDLSKNYIEVDKSRIINYNDSELISKTIKNIKNEMFISQISDLQVEENKNKPIDEMLIDQILASSIPPHQEIPVGDSYTHTRNNCNLCLFVEGRYQEYCTKCICFICQVPCNKCKYWKTHCKAHHGNHSSCVKRYSIESKVNQNTFYPNKSDIANLNQTYFKELNCTDLANDMKLTKYQKQALAWMYDIEKNRNMYICKYYTNHNNDIIEGRPSKTGGIISLAPGMGKTLIIISNILQTMNLKNNIYDITKETVEKVKNKMIIHPKYIHTNLTIYITQNSLPLQVYEEFKRYAPQLKVGILFDKDRNHTLDNLDNLDVVILTYHKIRDLKGLIFRKIIIDESHLIKAIGRPNMCSLSQRAETIWLLSGTAMENITDQISFIGFPIELITSIKKSPQERTSFLANKNYFYNNMDSSMVSINDMKKYIFNVNKDNSINDTIINNTKNIEYIFSAIIMSENENNEYKLNKCKDAPRTSENILNLSNNINFNEIYNNSGINNQVIYCSNGAISKFNKFKNDIKDLKPTDSVVIFTNFDETVKVILNILRKCKNINVYNGNSAAASRQRVMEKFQNVTNDKINILVTTYHRASVGLTLTKANIIIFWDPVININTKTQAIARINRIGQLNDIKVISYYYKESIEEHIINYHKDPTKNIINFKYHEVDDKPIVKIYDTCKMNIHLKYIDDGGADFLKLRSEHDVNEDNKNIIITYTSKCKCCNSEIHTYNYEYHKFGLGYTSIMTIYNLLPKLNNDLIRNTNIKVGFSGNDYYLEDFNNFKILSYEINPHIIKIFENIRTMIAKNTVILNYVGKINYFTLFKDNMTLFEKNKHKLFNKNGNNSDNGLSNFHTCTNCHIFINPINNKIIFNSADNNTIKLIDILNETIDEKNNKRQTDTKVDPENAKRIKTEPEQEVIDNSKKNSWFEEGEFCLCSQCGQNCKAPQRAQILVCPSCKYHIQKTYDTANTKPTEYSTKKRKAVNPMNEKNPKEAKNSYDLTIPTAPPGTLKHYDLTSSTGACGNDEEKDKCNHFIYDKEGINKWMDNSGSPNSQTSLNTELGNFGKRPMTPPVPTMKD